MRKYKSVKKKLIKEKEEELERHRLVAEYLKHRIEEGKETNRRETLTQIQTMMEELERQINFYKK